MKSKLQKDCKITKVKIFDSDKTFTEDQINEFLMKFPQAQLILVTDKKMIFKYKTTITLKDNK